MTKMAISHPNQDLPDAEALWLLLIVEVGEGGGGVGTDGLEARD